MVHVRELYIYSNSSLFTPGEFLKQFRRAFHELNEVCTVLW